MIETSRHETGCRVRVVQRIDGPVEADCICTELRAAYARGRADEREALHSTAESLRYEGDLDALIDAARAADRMQYERGRADEREAAVRRVAALPTRGGPYSGYTISRDDALAAIRGEGSNGS